MSILTLARYSIVNSGYTYYIENRVQSCEQVDNHRFQSKVLGTENNPYQVSIDIEFPENSSCTCPYARGDRICKHMIATYFSIFPDEADDYGASMKSLYIDDDFEREYLDEYDDEDSYEFPSTYPLCFDDILDQYINKLTEKDLKQLLKSELQKDKEYTFYKYLQDDYQMYLKNNHNEQAFIEQFNQKIISLLNHLDYNYYNHSSQILTHQEKEKIYQLYDHNKTFTESLDQLLLNTKLAIFDDYSWIAQFYKTRLDKNKKESYLKELNEFFQFLKNYSISNQIPKVNTLKTIFIFSHFSMKETVNSMIINARYKEYISYLIQNTPNKHELYKIFKNEAEHHIYKKELPNIFLEFYSQLNQDMNIFYEYLYYDILINKNKSSLMRLKSSPDFQQYIERILKKTKNNEVLEIVYSSLNRVDDLYALLLKQNKDYLFIRNIDVLKEKYSHELYQLFHHRVYEILDEGMGRDVYRKAALYISYIARLDDNKCLFNQIMNELRYSDHRKKPALFDEIKKAIYR